MNSNSFVCGPRIGRGKDSVTRIRRLSTGRYPSSPSLSRLVAPTALYVRKSHSSGMVSRHEYVRDSMLGTSKSCSGDRLPKASSRDSRVRASDIKRPTLPVCRAADWLVTLTVNSMMSPSRTNRGGLGWTIRSFAVTVVPVKKPLRI